MSKHVAIIKYNSGNVLSVQYALQRIGISSLITNDTKEIKNASHVIFPGVGHAGSAMEYIKANQLDEVIKDLQQPVLGICLGLQLMCSHTDEGNTDCLGIFDADVMLFEKKDASDIYKIPQVGWNNLTDLNSDLFKNISEGAEVYSVHSYYASLCSETIARTEYITEYSAALQKNNFYAVQFHPEKSGEIGEKILSNFIAL